MTGQGHRGFGRNVGVNTHPRLDDRQALDLVVVVTRLLLVAAEIQSCHQVEQSAVEIRRSGRGLLEDRRNPVSLEIEIRCPVM